ncbi:counting factor associated protein D-like [Montipora foliosa]|uniref:counting factor associated protein D-like n=1 Tax=Montipora foliosa TaxID=591990 RepID=UPI0035F16AEA
MSGIRSKSVKMKTKHNTNSIPTLLTVYCLLTLKLACLINHCAGQHYFFEEIKKILNSTTDPEELNTERRNDTDTEDPTISFENATLLQDDELKDSIFHELKFPDFYHAQGIISLPYDGIIEPFEAWYAGQHEMSRIDYYYGMDKTYQRGDLKPYGVLVKFVPAHWSKGKNLNKNSQTCWYRPGFRWSPERAQSVVPINLKGFQYVGQEIHSGFPVHKLQRKATVYKKENTYTFFVTKAKPHKPVRYVMHGYDTLLHSFYDHYIVDYLTFHEWKFNYDVMKIPRGKFNCLKKIDKMKSRYHFNPMGEFMHENFEDSEVDEMFEEFKLRHGKSYEDPYEHEHRKRIFRHNIRFINSKNRAALNFTLEPNELSDVTDDEFEMYKGLLIDPSGGDETLKKQEIPEARLKIPTIPPPNSLDWREYGAVTPSKAQGLCGSCWTFSSTGPIEGAYAIQTGKLVDISEQQLMDCSWGFGNSGCRGGFSWKALVWARKHGVASSHSYGRYLAQEGYCHCAEDDDCEVVKFQRLVTVKKLDENALIQGLARFGPASVAISVGRKSLKFYSSGVYDDPECSEKTNHGVVVVGYGEENGTPYWIVKNSWGKFWGEEGFVKIARKNNLCGVLTNEPIFVSMNSTNVDDPDSNYPFLRMKKQSFVDVEKELNVTSLKLSPFDYKRSKIGYDGLFGKPRESS